MDVAEKPGNLAVCEHTIQFLQENLRSFSRTKCAYIFLFCIMNQEMQNQLTNHYVAPKFHKLDVCGPAHHSTIHKEKPNKMQQCIKITNTRTSNGNCTKRMQPSGLTKHAVTIFTYCNLKKQRFPVKF
jgi:hypothetical protein